MLKTRERKILRDVWARKGRTTLVVMSIMIGVFGVVSLVSISDLLISQIKNNINPDNLPMTHVFVTLAGDGTQVDNDTVLQTVAGLPGVTRVEGQSFYPMFWQKPGEERFNDAFIMAYSAPFGAIEFEPMRLVDGEYPKPGKNQLAVEKRFANKNNVDIGDKLVVRVLRGSAGVSVQEWQVTGIVFHPYLSVIGHDDGINQGIEERKVFANYEDAQKIAGFAGFSILAVRYTDFDTAEQGVDLLKSTLAAETPYIPLRDWTEDPNHYSFLEEMLNMTGILNSLAVLAMVVSCFLVVNVINAIVTEQRRQIGALKSIGATRWDTFLIYCGTALIYGVLGTIPGVIIGALVGGLLTQSIAPMLSAVLIERLTVSPLAIGLGIVLGLAVPLVAVVIPVFNGTRVSILEAMTDLGISSNWGQSRLARLIGALPLPLNARQALSNVVQKGGRLALTGITLTLAAAAFMGVFALYSAFNATVKDIYDTIAFEIQLIPTEIQDYETVRNLLLTIDRVENVYPGVMYYLELEGFSSTDSLAQGSNLVNALGIDPANTPLEFDYTAGASWSDDPNREAVVITDLVAAEINKGVGDSLVISSGTQAQPRELEIVAIHNSIGSTMYVSWPLLAEMAGFIKAGNPQPTTFFITMDTQDPTAAEVDQTIEDISAVLAAKGITAEATNIVGLHDSETRGVGYLNLILQITSGVMAAVGAIGLLSTLSMSVFERQKEIGVMRAVGARSSTIINQFLMEGVLVGVLAWAVAIPLSYSLAQFLLANMDFMEFDFVYPLWVLGLGLVGVVMVAMLASMWPSIAASRKTVSDILRYQ